MHVFIDQTDVRRLEKAKNDMRCQKIMFASASHEFRTPLNAILNSIDLLEIKNKQIGDYIRKELVKHIGHHHEAMQVLIEEHKHVNKYLKIGINSSKLLKSLIEDVLNLSKIEAGIFKIHKNRFVVMDLI